MEILKYDCQIVGVITHGNSCFARVNVDNREIELPVPSEIFHKIKMDDAIISLEFNQSK